MIWDAVIGLMIASLIGLGVWVVDNIYTAKAENAVAKNVTDNICQDIKGIKHELRGIKEEIKEQNKEIQSQQKEMYNLLIDINKKVNK